MIHELPLATIAYIMLVTHDLRQVEKMCDYVYWLEQGTVHASGKPSEVVAQYEEFMVKQA